MCVYIQCLYLNGILVAHVCIQVHVMCVYIIVGVYCEYSRIFRVLSVNGLSVHSVRTRMKMCICVHICKIIFKYI